MNKWTNCVWCIGIYCEIVYGALVYTVNSLNSTHTRLHKSPCNFKGTCYKYNNKKHLYPLFNAQRQHKTHTKNACYLRLRLPLNSQYCNKAGASRPEDSPPASKQPSNLSSGASTLLATAATPAATAATLLAEQALCLQQLQPTGLLVGFAGKAAIVGDNSTASSPLAYWS